jgi:hypothetical protein
MPVPDGLSAAEAMPVAGRQGLRIQQRFQFGPYQAHQVERSWTRGRDHGSSARVRQFERRQDYSFRVARDGEDLWFTSCRVSLDVLRLDVGGAQISPTDESVLACTLRSLAGREEWEMEASGRWERPLVGSIRRGAERMELVGTDRLQHWVATGSTTGYEIRSGSRVVGAVEVINRGAVWLAPDLADDRRDLLAAVGSALLLLEDLRETVRE